MNSMAAQKIFPDTAPLYAAGEASDVRRVAMPEIG
jgi:hypothetical protein